MRVLVVVMVVAVVTACGDAARSAPSDGCRTSFVAGRYRGAANEARPFVPRLRHGVHAPGLAVAVAVHGRLAWVVTCGFADRERRLRVTSTTRFRIGSVSKPLTAAALARLVDRGTVGLDAPIQQYVPTFPKKRWPITLRELASHTAGVRANEADELVNTRHYATISAALPIFENDVLLFEPGTDFSYSNWGYVLIGAALEGATGKTYEQVMRDEVLNPLRLTHTVLEDVTRPVGSRAKPYELDARDRPVPAPYHDVSWRWPAGGFLSTAPDLARFGSTFVEGNFVSRSTVRLFTTEERTRGGKPTGYALGWETRPGSVGHTGNTVGGTAGLLVHLASSAALAVTTNVGYVTAPAPRVAPGTPDPSRLLLPFVEAR